MVVDISIISLHARRVKIILIPQTITFFLVLPDYQHKLFADERCNFILLMETLPMYKTLKGE
jgi:hypothetical protein